MVGMMTEKREHYDAIIVGVGQAGNPLATALSRAGWRTAVIERRFVGGTCVNDGCTPTKTMIASGRVAYLARRADDYGVHVGGVAVSLAEVRQRKQEIVDASRSSIHHRLRSLDNVELIYGTARFDGHKSIAVALQEGGIRYLAAGTVFINTGARPAKPPIPGIDSTPTLDSTTIMEIDELPSHLLVLGGGYIGLEFAQLYRRLGSRVTIVQRSAQLITREDADVAAALTDILREDGIDVLLETSAVRAERNAAGGVSLAVKDAQGEHQLQASHLLVAAGRTPNTDDLDLAAAGIERDKNGYVRADERLETNVEGIYALGDVKGGPAFTHISYDDYRIVSDNLLAGGRRTTHDRLVPYTIFTDPELGRVGLNEQEARKQGRPVRVATMPMSSVARAGEVGETRGLIKALVDPETDRILGCAVLGIAGGEIMSMLQIAMLGNLPYTALRDGVFAHPTLAESLNTLFGKLA
jgi:pyruvate/2-oxoglutarate dehydrogenase complex dihydrolipoamide dehydrogenase (E3) component